MTASPHGRTVAPRLLPIYLETHPTESFTRQLDALKLLSGDFVEWLPPLQIGLARPWMPPQS